MSILQEGRGNRNHPTPDETMHERISRDGENPFVELGESRASGQPTGMPRSGCNWENASEAATPGLFRLLRAQARGCWDEIYAGRLMPSAKGLIHVKAGWHLEAEFELTGGRKQGLRIWARVGDSIHDVGTPFHERVSRINATSYCTKIVHDTERGVLFAFAHTFLPDTATPDAGLVSALFHVFIDLVGRPEVEATINLGGGRIVGFERPTW